MWEGYAQCTDSRQDSWRLQGTVIAQTLQTTGLLGRPSWMWELRFKYNGWWVVSSTGIAVGKPAGSVYGKVGIPFPAEMEELLPQPVGFSFHQVYAKI